MSPSLPWSQGPKGIICHNPSCFRSLLHAKIFLSLPLVLIGPVSPRCLCLKRTPRKVREQPTLIRGWVFYDSYWITGKFSVCLLNTQGRRGSPDSNPKPLELHSLPKLLGPANTPVIQTLSESAGSWPCKSLCGFKKNWWEQLRGSREMSQYQTSSCIWGHSLTDPCHPATCHLVIPKHFRHPFWTQHILVGKTQNPCLRVTHSK